MQFCRGLWYWNFSKHMLVVLLPRIEPIRYCNLIYKNTMAQGLDLIGFYWKGFLGKTLSLWYICCLYLWNCYIIFCMYFSANYSLGSVSLLAFFHLASNSNQFYFLDWRNFVYGPVLVWMGCFWRNYYFLRKMTSTSWLKMNQFNGIKFKLWKLKTFDLLTYIDQLLATFESKPTKIKDED